MALILAKVGDGSGVIASTDPDPNTTPPTLDRMFKVPSPSPGAGSPIAWLTAEGGTPTVELWFLVEFLGETPGSRWFRWNATTVSPAVDQMTPLTTRQVATELTAFLRVTAVGGATRISFGYSS